MRRNDVKRAIVFNSNAFATIIAVASILIKSKFSKRLSTACKKSRDLGARVDVVLDAVDKTTENIPKSRLQTRFRFRFLIISYFASREESKKAEKKLEQLSRSLL